MIGGQRSARGFSFVELLAASAILMVLAAALVPIYRWDQKRRNERHLRIALQLMRDAIDQYKKYSDEGMILQTDVSQMGYPKDLDELVEGVDVGDPEAKTKKLTFLRRIPVDPMTGTAEWGMRSYQDDFDSDSWGGENVFDVYSLSPGQALDGTYYRDW